MIARAHAVALHLQGRATQLAAACGVTHMLRPVVLPSQKHQYEQLPSRPLKHVECRRHPKTRLRPARAKQAESIGAGRGGKHSGTIGPRRVVEEGLPPRPAHTSTGAKRRLAHTNNRSIQIRWSLCDRAGASQKNWPRIENDTRPALVLAHISRRSARGTGLTPATSNDYLLSFLWL